MAGIPEKLHKYPHTDIFMVIGTIPVPHPFCIGHRHVTYAAKHSNGILSKESIKRSGAPCATCAALVRKGKMKEVLSYDEHKKALLVEINDPEDRELKDVPGIHEYLLSIKEMTDQDGYAGWAFTKGK